MSKKSHSPYTKKVKTPGTEDTERGSENFETKPKNEEEKAKEESVEEEKVKEDTKKDPSKEEAPKEEPDKTARASYQEYNSMFDFIRRIKK